MRILAFTDIHGSYDRVEAILSRESIFDAVIIGGDLTTHGTVGEASEAIRRFQQFRKPVLAVAGNMDLPAFDEVYKTLGVNIDAQGVLFDDVGFFGIAGSPFTPMHTPYEISEEEIKRRAESGWQVVQAARWKIFVPHAPPRDTKLDKIFSENTSGAQQSENSLNAIIRMCSCAVTSMKLAGLMCSERPR